MEGANESRLAAAKSGDIEKLQMPVMLPCPIAFSRGALAEVTAGVTAARRGRSHRESCGWASRGRT
jgi:hypothetical protein